MPVNKFAPVFKIKKLKIMTGKTKWAIDPMHSEVQFKIKHLVISTVTGSFKKFEGTIVRNGEDFTGADVNFEIDVASIDTNQPKRDEHLKSRDFFDVETYPKISFTSTSFLKSGEDYKIIGNLTIRNITKTIELDVEYGGFQKDIEGNMKHGFEVTGKIKRKEFDMNFNALTETGGLTLGEEVKLIANIQVANHQTELG